MVLSLEEDWDKECANIKILDVIYIYLKSTHQVYESNIYSAQMKITF